MDELAMKVPVGEWINIDNFSLTNAPLRVHFEKNPLKMNFLHNMDISESTLRIDDHFLDLVDFETILTGKNDTNILIDLIGQVLDLSDLDTVHCTGGKERKKLETSKEDADFPDTITTLIGQTFTFGVYVEKDNATAEGVCYKFGKVWKDLKLLKIGENSESCSAPTSNFVAEAPLLLEDNEPNEAASTPSSKRKSEENKDTPDKTSTSKKPCTKVIKKEKK
ncbi:hypothetical protein YC2023_108902 [Brassica napus]